MTVQNETDVLDLADLKEGEKAPPKRRRRGFSSREIGASQEFHTECPCCGLRFAVDFTEAQQSALDGAEQTLRRRTIDLAQRYFTDVWKWKTHERGFNHWDENGVLKRGGGKYKSRSISSNSIDHVSMVGVGKHLRSSYRKHLKTGTDLWFAILWHNVPSINENFIAIPLGRLFEVLQAIADDAPEFRYRLRLAADNAIRRESTTGDHRRDRQVAPKRAERRVEEFDVPGTVEV